MVSLVKAGGTYVLVYDKLSWVPLIYNANALYQYMGYKHVTRVRILIFHGRG